MTQNPGPDAVVENPTIMVDGKTLTCRPQTSLAVALWEQGIRHLSHSHKYGRPRGITCARGHCTNCLMRVDGVPNVRTCETPLRDGMVVATQDTGAFYGPPMQKMLGLSSQWIPVGFYYKWFTKPASLSRFFLDRIRPMTGVGRLPDAQRAHRALPAAPTQDPASLLTAPEKELGHFDTIIVGAGPSGLQAATKISGRTLIIDDNAEPGGQRRAALREIATQDDQALARFPSLKSAHDRIETAAAALAEIKDCHFLDRAKAIAGYHPNGLLVRQGDNLMSAHFDNLVWAAGALDVFGLFPGNDTPGLLGPRALYRLLTRDGMNVAGRHALLIGGGLDFWLSANLLACRGASVSLVVTETGCQSEVAAAVDLKWPLNTGLRLEEVKGIGGRQVQATFVPRLSTPGPTGSHMHIEADLAVICQQAKPTYDIPFQLGADLALTPARGGFVPRGCEEENTSSFNVTLPSGAGLQYSGEALGLNPTDQVT